MNENKTFHMIFLLAVTATSLLPAYNDIFTQKVGQINGYGTSKYDLFTTNNIKEKTIFTSFFEQASAGC